MKLISWEHAWILLLSGCVFVSLRDTTLFHPVIALLIYGVLLANHRFIALERKAAALARKEGGQGNGN